LKVKIKNRRKAEFDAEIILATSNDLKSLSNDWKFTWRKLVNSKAIFYKLVFNDEIQGLIKLEEENELYYVLKNIEVSPLNFGSNGKYKNIAETLMAFACFKSFELNSGNYKGFLVFISKGTLIEYYQKRYGAELIFRERMIISSQQGKKLILQYLKLDLDNE